MLGKQARQVHDGTACVAYQETGQALQHHRTLAASLLTGLRKPSRRRDLHRRIN
jgi:hypothetical protein